MKPISKATLEKVSHEFETTFRAKADETIWEFVQTQPALSNYIQAEKIKGLSQDEREIIFIIGLQIWWVMAYKGDVHLKRVTWKVLKEKETANRKWARSVDGDDDYFTAELENYNQRDILACELYGLFDDMKLFKGETSAARCDKLAKMAVAIKTIIDCLDQQPGNSKAAMRQHKGIQGTNEKTRIRGNQGQAE